MKKILLILLSISVTTTQPKTASTTKKLETAGIAVAATAVIAMAAAITKTSVDAYKSLSTVNKVKALAKELNISADDITKYGGASSQKDGLEAFTTNIAEAQNMDSLHFDTYNNYELVDVSPETIAKVLLTDSNLFAKIQITSSTDFTNIASNASDREVFTIELRNAEVSVAKSALTNGNTDIAITHIKNAIALQESELFKSGRTMIEGDYPDLEKEVLSSDATDFLVKNFDANQVDSILSDLGLSDSRVSFFEDYINRLATSADQQSAIDNLESNNFINTSEATQIRGDYGITKPVNGPTDGPADEPSTTSSPSNPKTGTQSGGEKISEKNIAAFDDLHANNVAAQVEDFKEFIVKYKLTKDNILDAVDLLNTKVTVLEDQIAETNGDTTQLESELEETKVQVEAEQNIIDDDSFDWPTLVD